MKVTLSRTTRTILAALGVVALVVVAYVTFLLTVVYRPIDAYAVTYEVTGPPGTAAPAKIDFQTADNTDPDRPPRPGSVERPPLPWREDVAIAAGAEAKISIAEPAAGLTCVVTVDKGHATRERVLSRHTAEAGQPLVCAAPTPTGETINAGLARPTPR